MSEQDCKSLLLDFLRKFPGQEVPYCSMLNTLAKFATDHDKIRNPVPYKKVRQVWANLQRALNQMVKDRVVISRHFQRDNGSWTKSIRINEAFVKNPFYNR